ncbi:MAG: hypothetical protein M3R13_01265 [Armatimonadota bacterium]|nr:hypothetical protein [Armatimonadota bacterium]
MRVTLAKFCDYACHVDGGKATLIGMFDTIGGNAFPLVHPTFFICVELEFQPLEGGRPVEIKLVLIDEDGKELFGVQGAFDAPRGNARPATLMQAFRIDNMSFPKAGSYRLDILGDGQPLGEALLYLAQGPPPQS